MHQGVHGCTQNHKEVFNFWQNRQFSHALREARIYTKFPTKQDTVFTFFFFLFFFCFLVITISTLIIDDDVRQKACEEKILLDVLSSFQTTQNSEQNS